MRNLLLKVCLTSTLLLLSTSPSSAHTTYPTYEELRAKAIYECPTRNWKGVDASVVDKLIAVEKQYNVHPSVRGMVLAAACLESGFNPKAKGDRKFSKNKKTPMAIGVLQMWKYYEKAYGVDRTDPVSSAHGWLKHIVRQLSKVKRQCKFKSKKKLWVAAWVTGIRYKKKGGRCYERPLHLKLLRRWQRKVRKDRRTQDKNMGSCDC